MVRCSFFTVVSGRGLPLMVAFTQDQVPVTRDLKFISFSAATPLATTSSATVAMSVFISWFVFVLAHCRGVGKQGVKLHRVVRVESRRVAWQLPVEHGKALAKKSYGAGSKLMIGASGCFG